MDSVGKENLLYVAVTRAKLVLQLNDSAQEAINYMKQSKDSQIKQMIGALFPESVCFEEVD